MNANVKNGRPAPIVDGMLVLCVDVDDANHETESGEIYLVCHTLNGAEEHTLRKATIHKDRTEYRCESTDDIPPLVIPHVLEAISPDNVYRIMGWVYGVSIIF